MDVLLYFPLHVLYLSTIYLYCIHAFTFSCVSGKGYCFVVLQVKRKVLQDPRWEALHVLITRLSRYANVAGGMGAKIRNVIL